MIWLWDNINQHKVLTHSHMLLSVGDGLTNYEHLPLTMKHQPPMGSTVNHLPSTIDHCRLTRLTSDRLSKLIVDDGDMSWSVMIRDDDS